MHNDLVCGIHAVTAVLKQTPQRVLLLSVLDGRHDRVIQEVLALASANGIEVQMASRKTLDKLLPEALHQGIVAHCRRIAARHYLEADIPELLSEIQTPPLLLLLDGVQDPHNLGACLRVADGAGVQMVIAPRDNSVGLTPVVCKVASGAAETVPYIQVTNLARTMRLLRDQGIWLYGAAEDSSTTLYQIDLRGASGIVMGGEGKGLRRLTQENCDQMLSIPMGGAVESLNVSVATGVCLFEAVRQRLTKKHRSS